ncbi:MAG: M1 family metallopeptidase [Candidatus Promineofilum sp.]|nr:M1 family metallopeptidase [Promineifilum sp.]
MKRLPVIVLFIALFLSFACRAAAGVTPVGTPLTITAAPPRPTTKPTAVPDTGPTAESLATAAPAASALFDLDPDDRSPFRAGLTSAGAEALDGLDGATVYHMAFTIGRDMSTVAGRQIVTYTNLEDVPLDDIYFHLHANTLEGRITVDGVTVDGAPVVPDTSDAGLLHLLLPSPLEPGAVATIDMTFETNVPTDIGRNYGVLAYYDDILALAHFYPMLAVYDDDGWNVAAPDIQGDLTYSDAAFYLVRVTAPDDVVLVGAGSIIAQSQSDGTQTVTFAAGPARDFYLAAGDFAVVSETLGETILNSYAPRGWDKGATQALDVAAAALADFNERLAPYPYSELDIVTTPTSALGIEYPGLIVGALRMYDVDAEAGSGIPYAAILESTTAHEMAHQWFYNLVGNDQLDEPWLDEAVGSYSTYRYFVDRYGQNAGDNYFDTFIGRWQRVDQAPIPIGLPVVDYKGDEYGAIVYGRGPIFLRELEETMGRDVFDEFLRDYIRQFRWEEGTTAAFRAGAEAHCDCDLEPLFKAWVSP